METTTRLGALVLALAGVLGSPDAFAQVEGGEDVAAPACRPDCRAGFTCIEGACVSACNPACADGQSCTASGECVAESSPAPAPIPVPAPVPGAPTAGTPASNTLANANATSNININVLGVLQFGPVVSYELGTRWAGHARLRVGNLGVLTYVGFDEEETPGIAFGVGAGIRKYGSQVGNLRGFYFGAASEYLRQDWSDAEGQSLTSSGVAAAFDIGYRWSTSSSFLYSVGGLAGWLLLIDSDDPEDDDSPFGMFVVELGWYL